MSTPAVTPVGQSPGLGARLSGLVQAAALAPLCMRGVGIVAGLGLQVLLARMLGAESFGLFAIALCLQAAAVVIGRTGLDTVIMQLGGPLWHGGDAARLHHVYHEAVRLAALHGTLVAVLLALAAEPLSELVFDKPELATAIAWMALSVVPASLLWVHAGMLKTMDRPARAYLVESVLVPVLSCLVIAGSLSWSAASAQTYAMLYTVCTALALVPAVRIVRSAMPLAPVLSGVPVIGWRNHCLPVLGIDAMNFLLAWAPFAMLAAVGSSSESGLFNVASRLALQVGTVLVVLGNVFAPRLSAACANAAPEALEALARRVSLLMLGIGSLPLAVMLFFPGLALWVFGPDFAAAAEVLQLLALGHLVNALTGPAGFLLVAAGEARLLRRILFSTGMLTLAFCGWAVAAHGAAGAAVAVSLGIVLQNVLASVAVWQRLGIQHIPFLPRRVRPADETEPTIPAFQGVQQ